MNYVQIGRDALSAFCVSINNVEPCSYRNLHLVFFSKVEKIPDFLLSIIFTNKFDEYTEHTIDNPLLDEVWCALSDLYIEFVDAVPMGFDAGVSALERIIEKPLSVDQYHALNRALSAAIINRNVPLLGDGIHTHRMLSSPVR